VNIPKSTAYRALKSLTDKGFLEASRCCASLFLHMAAAFPLRLIRV